VHKALIDGGYIDAQGNVLKNYPTFNGLVAQNMAIEHPPITPPPPRGVDAGAGATPIPPTAVSWEWRNSFPRATAPRPGLQKMYLPHGHLAVANRAQLQSHRRRLELEEEMNGISHEPAAVEGNRSNLASLKDVLGPDGMPCFQKIRAAYDEMNILKNEFLADLYDFRKCTTYSFLVFN